MLLDDDDDDIDDIDDDDDELATRTTGQVGLWAMTTGPRFKVK